MSDLSGKTTIVVGASRGLGRGIATALADAGASVVAVSRAANAFAAPANGAGTIRPEVADAGDATVPASLLDRYEPQAVVLVAGASPHMRPLRFAGHPRDCRQRSGRAGTGRCRHHGPGYRLTGTVLEKLP